MYFSKPYDVGRSDALILLMSFTMYAGSLIGVVVCKLYRLVQYAVQLLIELLSIMGLDAFRRPFVIRPFRTVQAFIDCCSISLQ